MGGGGGGWGYAPNSTNRPKVPAYQPELPPPLPLSSIRKDALFQEKKVPRTMESIRRRALLDLFVTPWTIGTTTIGFSTVLLSWAFGGGAAMTFLGFLGVLIGLGWAGTNFALNLESVINNAAKTVELESKEAANQRLDELDRKLCLDRDPRDQTYLRDMREIFDAFMADYNAGKLSEFCNTQTVEQIKELFDTVVKKLEAAHELWDTSRTMRGKPKELAQADREKIIEEVGKAVEHMGETISGIRALKVKTDVNDFDRLREKLDGQLNAARRSVERMDSINEELREKQ
jgi:hypothetical protein